MQEKIKKLAAKHDNAVQEGVYVFTEQALMSFSKDLVIECSAVVANLIYRPLPVLTVEAKNPKAVFQAYEHASVQLINEFDKP